MMRIYIAAIIASATLLCAAFVVHASTNIFSLDEKNYSAVMKTDSNGAETGEIVIYGRLENGQAFPETIVVKYSPDLKLGHEVPSTVCELLPHQKLRVADGQFIRCMVPSYDLEKGQSENEHPKAAPEQSPGGNQRQKAIPEQQQPGSENEHPKAAPEPSQGGNQQQANRPERAVPQQQQPGKEPPKQVEPQQSGGEAVEPGKEYVIEPAHLYYYRLCAKNNTTECSPSLPLYVMIMRGELDSDKDLVPDSLNGVKLDDCTDKPNFDQNPNACRWRVSMIPGFGSTENKGETTEEIEDTDKDGVPDNKDGCPDTPSGVAVDERGCPLDTTVAGVSPQAGAGDISGGEQGSSGCTLIR